MSEELPPTMTLLEAEPCHCRWPYGEGQEICGRQIQPPGRYCFYHSRHALRKFSTGSAVLNELSMSVLSEIG